MTQSANAASPVSLFDEAISDIDKIFSVSGQLKEFFVSSLESAASGRVLPSQLPRAPLANAARALRQIGDSSIKQAERDILATLYRQGVIAVVSAAEQILKSTFNGLVVSNLKSISKNEKLTVEIDDLKKIDFQTTPEYWADKIIEDLYGGKGPQEKLNFQNIKAVEELLKSFFEIDLSQIPEYTKVAKTTHYFYQVRHILLHNAGFVDKRFIDNLQAAGINTKNLNLQVGKKLVVQKRHYEESKKAFFDLFLMLEAAIEQRNLIVDASL